MRNQATNTVRVTSAAQAAELVKEAQVVAGTSSRQFVLMDGQISDFNVAFDGYGLTIGGTLVDNEIDEAARAGKLFTRVLN